MTQPTNPDMPTPPLMWDAERAIPGLQINPYHLTDRWSSGHGVMFGELPEVGRVVVKPHTTIGHAEDEAAKIGHIEDAGITTPQLHGLAEGNRASYLVTHHYPGLTTLGESDLRVGVADPRLRRSLMPAITDAARGLADMHVKRAIHGDFQAKNAARGPNGEFVAIDLERSQVGTTGKQGELLRAKDAYSLPASLLIRKFMADRTPNYRVGALDAAVLGPHAETVNGHGHAQVDYEKVVRALKHTARTGQMLTGPQIQQGLPK